MTKKKFFIAALFSLPVIFFIISYFCNTVSSEDIYQGANTFTGAFESAVQILFSHGRLPDAYGFFVIKFFNYQFEFGVDFFFRLFDVIMGCATFYLLVAFALGRRLKLELKDALLFNFASIILFLTPHGSTIYSGFSFIHNYLLIGLLPLIFFIPFVKELNGARISQKPFFAILMLIMGVIFGLSSNLVPLAYVITLVIFACYKLFRHQSFKNWLKPWKITSFVGIMLGIFLSFFVFSGVGNYINEAYILATDYISIADIFSNSSNNIPRLFSHEYHNFFRLLLPLIILSIALYIFFLIFYKNHHIKKLHFSKTQKSTIIFTTVFMIVNMLTLSQILAPIRLIYPSYLCGIIIVLIFSSTIYNNLNTKLSKNLLIILTIIISSILIILRGYFTIEYSIRMSQVLLKIKNSPSAEICISQDSIHTKTAPADLFVQEDMLTGWVMPAKIYDKTVTFCQNP